MFAFHLICGVNPAGRLKVVVHCIAVAEPYRHLSTGSAMTVNGLIMGAWHYGQADCPALSQ
jgi:hypothetical protein